MTRKATDPVIPIKPLELIEGTYDQFIGIYDNHVPKFLCDRLIDLADKSLDTDFASGSHSAERSSPSDDIRGSVMQGQNQFPAGSLGRKDESILVQYSDALLHSELNQYLSAAFLHYSTEYGIRQQFKLISYDQKLQRTKPGGGYHVWHAENTTYEMAHRTLVWMIYLNDDFTGGETEFLHQHKRLTPKRGTVVIWPAAWTHQHRGNPPLEGTKYILTGWYINCPL